MEPAEDAKPLSPEGILLFIIVAVVFVVVTYIAIPVLLPASVVGVVIFYLTTRAMKVADVIGLVGGMLDAGIVAYFLAVVFFPDVDHVAIATLSVFTYLALTEIVVNWRAFLSGVTHVLGQAMGRGRVVK